MPWVPYQKPPGESPAHYDWPIVLSDDTVLGRNIEYAKQQRKEIGQIRESIVAAQKECGKSGDRDNARALSEIASDLMMQYRGWDAAIKMIDDEDYTRWPRPNIAEQIAPYVDRAFDFMELQPPSTPPRSE